MKARVSSRKRRALTVTSSRATAGGAGPDLTWVGDRLTHGDIVIRIVNGGVNMPAFGKSLKPEELAKITAFVESRKQPVPGTNSEATENK